MRDGSSPGGPWSDDAALVDALRRGDEAAFSWLIDRYHRPLRSVALGLVGGNAAVADEVVQETWLGVVNGIDRFEGRSSLKTWLFRILTNRAKTRGERERRTVPFSALATDDLAGEERTFEPDRFLGPDAAWPGHWAAAPAAWERQPEERLASAETRAVIASAIAALPDAQRTVLYLRDVQGFSSAEAADLLGVSDGNQRVLLHRARGKVRRALEAHFEAEAAEVAP